MLACVGAWRAAWNCWRDVTSAGDAGAASGNRARPRCTRRRIDEMRGPDDAVGAIGASIGGRVALGDRKRVADAHDRWFACRGLSAHAQPDSSGRATQATGSRTRGERAAFDFPAFIVRSASGRPGSIGTNITGISVLRVTPVSVRMILVK